MELRSLKGFRGGGLEVGELLHRDPGRYVKKGSVYGNFSPRGPFPAERNLGSGEGAHIPGTLKDE